MANSSMPSEGIERIRLNISAHVSDEVVSRFLIVVESEAGMDQLVDKVQRRLKQGGIKSTVERVLNSSRSILPNDEFLGDLFRDGEELVVELRGQDGRLLRSPRHPPSADVSGVSPSSPNRASASSPRKAALRAELASPTSQVPATLSASGNGSWQIQLRPQLRNEESEEEDEEEEVFPPKAVLASYPPSAATLPGPLGSTQLVPGPSEAFELNALPYDTMKVDHPCEPIQPMTYDNDWLVESLSPQLREFVLDHFQSLTTEPTYVPSIGKYVGPRFYQKSGAFVTIFMRPQATLGSDPGNSMPVHYNITKHELMTFQRQAELQMQKCQRHLEWFSKAMNGLQGFLQKGMSETAEIIDMLPHSYAMEEEVEGIMMEVERPLFPKIEGASPIIIIDTSGPAMHDHIVFLKAALKRALYGHMRSKKSFQLIRFAAACGEPRLWMKGMVTANDQAMTLAEDWIDNLAAVPSARLVQAIRYAMAHQDCDSIYIVSSGACVDKLEHDTVLASIRQLNTREVRIDSVGIEPNHLGELLLRRISESNHGDITLKFFNGCSTSQADVSGGCWRTNCVNEKSKQLSDNFKKPKMSIGSQVRIIEVMQNEERKKEEAWMEEWTCTQRLLESAELSKKNGSIDRDMVKEMERKYSHSRAKRTGGGYKYEVGKPDLSLERMFEHQSSVPWTANSDTAATGPKVPRANAGQHRMAKFPPSSERLPEALNSSASEMPKQRARPRSAGMASTLGSARQSTLPPPGGNPWSTMPPKRAVPPYPARAAPPSSGSRAGPLPAINASARSTSVDKRPPSGSARRMASADKAAGERAPSPAPNSKVGSRRPVTPGHEQPPRRPTSARAQEAVTATAPVVRRSQPFTLQRRWSF